MLILPSISFLIEDCVPAVQGFCCVFVLAVDQGKRLCGPNIEYLLQGPSGSQLHEAQGAGHCYEFTHTHRLGVLSEGSWTPINVSGIQRGLLWSGGRTLILISHTVASKKPYLAGIWGEGLCCGGCVGVRHGSAPGRLVGFVCRGYLTSLWKKLSSISACEFEQEKNGFLPSFWARVGANEKWVSPAS